MISEAQLHAARARADVVTYGEADPLLIQEARNFIAGATFTYATTRPKNPHWYVVTHNQPATVFTLHRLITNHGGRRSWHTLGPWPTINLDGWAYWIIEPVINRVPADVVGWDGDPKPPLGWCPLEWRTDLPGTTDASGYIHPDPDSKLGDSPAAMTLDQPPEATPF